LKGESSVKTRNTIILKAIWLRMHANKPPGTIFEATITRIGSEGDGVGPYNNFHVIVPKTAIGDKISCMVKYTTKDRIHANLIHILEASPNRILPPCEYFNECGGCSLQHINSDAYKNYKLGLLTSILNNNNIPLPSEISWFSVGKQARRRAFVRFEGNASSLANKAKLGFHEHQTHNIIDIKQCLILETELDSLLAPLKELSLKLGINIEGWMLTNTDSGIDITLHSDNVKIKNASFIFKTLAGFANSYSTPIKGHSHSRPNIARISWRRGKNNISANTITDPILLVAGKKITLPNEYFLQAAKSGQEAILSAVIRHIDDGAKILDLFSGLGIYSFAVADKASKSYAYEIDPQMVEAMEDNIRKHGLGDKISAYCRDIEKFPLGRDELAKFDIAIINPPRTGALKQIGVLAAGGIKKIIMVSCNSGTFARDAKILHDSGYKLTSLSAIDQFYYSHHLEQVGIFAL